MNGIHGVITRSERKLLILFERHCYLDGQIYPKQKTIAHKLGITVRQVRRLIASLVKKGFLAVVPPSLVDRHIYGKGNRYHLLDHPAYHQMSSEKSSETEDHTIIYNKEIKTKGRFNIVEFLERNQAKHSQAIIDALNALTARWPSIRFPGAYAQKIVDIQSGNYAEKEHNAITEQQAAEFSERYAGIVKELSCNLGMEKALPAAETPAQTAERLERQKREILSRY
jgi:hypothetical protein